MGRAAVDSHLGTPKHKKMVNLAKANTKITFIRKPQENIIRKPQESNKKLSNFFVKRETLVAEILWCLHVVENHYSLNSVDKSIPIIKRMCKDSTIA
ncbi:hypothetical protein NQ315_011320 [Exocentrus adspersus]|uniref:Uncharacterized protein n=1 Tax=Exocentrus adspersus TaxID=1586481 RepID=A0AAV8VK70_9CUCU|nr:hypothetical protein NQ315_011320 [Exocentrus adspersus]